MYLLIFDNVADASMENAVNTSRVDWHYESW